MGLHGIGYGLCMGDGHHMGSTLHRQPLALGQTRCQNFVHGIDDGRAVGTVDQQSRDYDRL